MDVLTGLLDGPRARDAFLLRGVLEAPWGLHVVDEAAVTLFAVAEGQAWVDLADGTPPTHLARGDVAIVRGPDTYDVVDSPGRVPEVVCLPGGLCVDRDGNDLHDAMALGVRTWGNDPRGSTVLLIGIYEGAGAVGERLLSALPRLVVVDAGRADVRLVELLSSEVVHDAPGQQAMLDRLLDLLLVSTLRRWFGDHLDDAPPWFRAAGDPIVGAALRLLHDDPARDWTVAALAAEVGASRAALARRFSEIVGEPPMAYLTGWRLALAADLLLEPGATVSSVALRVGYSSPYALSAAFSRVRGVSPRAHRTAALT